MALIARYRLLSAVASGRVDQVRRLLAAGADPDAVNARGFTALMVAAASGHVAVIEALLEYGADLNRGVSVKLPGREPAHDVTPLMVASGHGGGNAAVVALLITHGARLDDTDSLGQSALTYAVFAADVDRARALLDAGARADIAANDGSTPLDAAREAGNAALVKLLIAASAATASRSSDGRVSRRRRSSEPPLPR